MFSKIGAKLASTLVGLRRFYGEFLRSWRAKNKVKSTADEGEDAFDKIDRVLTAEKADYEPCLDAIFGSSPFLNARNEFLIISQFEERISLL